MSQLTASTSPTDLGQLEKLGVSIRGKLQFMDYLVRAALADVDRFHDEADAGTRIFIQQLVEMHATNLGAEGENMRQVHEFCNALVSALQEDSSAIQEGDAA